MVEVGAGEFYFGDEAEPRYLPRFWIDKYEVTNAEYLAYVKKTGAPIPHHWRGGPLGRFPPRGQQRWPVRYLSRAEVLAYVQWAGKDLPTEMEWEKAARGTDHRLYPWGEWDKSCLSYYDHAMLGTGPVGMHPQGASPYGVEDMLGNVFEWTKSDTSPSGTTRPYAVVRGGCDHSTDFRKLTLTWRNAFAPSGHYPYVGFRCVRREPRHHKGQ